jgi:hypothetical protein
MITGLWIMEGYKYSLIHLLPSVNHTFYLFNFIREKIIVLRNEKEW